MPSRAEHSYPEVPQQPHWPILEEEVLKYWASDDTFAATVHQREAGTNEYVFYDGPPFANGLPHYGHLLTGFVKDAVPRYQTMRGRRVERRFGWDCHGLPAEVEAEKELGLTGRAGITGLGIGQFNDHCRTLVLRTTDAWEHFVTRQARWVDFVHDYKTMDLPYMESVMWAFSQLWKKGLAYEGYRVLPYCWECETPLSNFETRQDDSYRPRQDPALTVSFTLGEDLPPELAAVAGNRTVKAIVWTTTPWTLPSNLALSVGADIEYAIVDRGGELWLLATTRLGAYAGVLGDSPTVVGTVPGSALVGASYRPLFPYFADHPGAFRVLAGDFVGEEEGTGIVHIAPGFGEDDQRVCDSNGITVVCPVDDRGRFTAPVSDYDGMQVFEANAPIARTLKAAGAVVAHETYEHSYPHCWRTDTPLIYKAMSSWFVAVTAIKDRMVELNRQITWVPEHVRDGAFGKWLEGARDWSISRNRFWGAPIPVWKSDDPRYPRIDVYGSLDELENDFGVRPSDLHRPDIDALTRPNPDDPTGASTMRRVPDVLDCWFESGSMPFAQLHYPFENADRFESHFPADFIVEYMAQTRGWFYTLHVLSTALFDCPPFRSCIAHGVVLGDDGRKLSKRLGNYPDPQEVFDSFGADAMRWFLLSSAVLRGGDIVVERSGMAEAVRQVLNPIWNAWYFLSLYSATDRVTGRIRTDQSGVLDRYILAKTASLVSGVTASLDAYDLPGATSHIASFIDALNNWYIRRSRDRFWRGWNGTVPGDGISDDPEDNDKIDAYDTLHTVLEVLLRAVAPLLPLLSEAIYRGLTGARSVHLADWPAPADLPSDPALVETMDLIREACSAAHSIRKACGLRARLPLASLTVAHPDAERFRPYAELIAEEVNVKEVILTAQVSSHADQVVNVVPSALGPRLGPKTQEVIRAVRAGNWRLDGDVLEAAGERLGSGEFAVKLEPRDPATSRALPESSGVVILDTTLSPALEAEGLARDLVRLVQNTRRDAGFHVADRIKLQVCAEPGITDQLLPHFDHVAHETLAVSLDWAGPGTPPAYRFTAAGELTGGYRVDLSLERVAG